LNGTTIAQHTAICEYLEETYPETNFLGTNAIERAETRRLVGWFDCKFYEEVTRNLIYEKVEKRYWSQGGPNPAAIRQGLHMIHIHLEYIRWLTDRRNWLAGQSFTLADMAAAAHLSTLDYLGDVPWDKHDSAKEWYARVKSRPSFRPLLTDQMPGVPPASHYHDLDF
jgi:glutathione S-transferase